MLKTQIFQREDDKSPLVFDCHEISINERAKITELVEEHGGMVGNCSVPIIFMPRPKYKIGMYHNLQIYDIEFIAACVQEGRIMSLADFRLGPKKPGDRCQTSIFFRGSCMYKCILNDLKLTDDCDIDVVSLSEDELYEPLEARVRRISPRGSEKNARFRINESQSVVEKVYWQRSRVNGGDGDGSVIRRSRAKAADRKRPISSIATDENKKDPASAPATQSTFETARSKLSQESTKNSETPDTIVWCSPPNESSLSESPINSPVDVERIIEDSQEFGDKSLRTIWKDESVAKSLETSRTSGRSGNILCVDLSPTESSWVTRSLTSGKTTTSKRVLKYSKSPKGKKSVWIGPSNNSAASSTNRLDYVEKNNGKVTPICIFEPDSIEAPREKVASFIEVASTEREFPAEEPLTNSRSGTQLIPGGSHGDVEAMLAALEGNDVEKLVGTSEKSKKSGNCRSAASSPNESLSAGTRATNKSTRMSEDVTYPKANRSREDNSPRRARTTSPDDIAKLVGTRRSPLSADAASRSIKTSVASKARKRPRDEHECPENESQTNSRDRSRLSSDELLETLEGRIPAQYDDDDDDAENAVFTRGQSRSAALSSSKSPPVAESLNTGTTATNNRTKRARCHRAPPNNPHDREDPARPGPSTTIIEETSSDDEVHESSTVETTTDVESASDSSEQIFSSDEDCVSDPNKRRGKAYRSKSRHQRELQYHKEWRTKLNASVKKASNSARFLRFTAAERNEMVKFLCTYDDIEILQPKGLKIWRTMIKKGILPHRTLKSLQNHFTKNILPNIESYFDGMSEAHREQFRNIRDSRRT